MGLEKIPTPPEGAKSGSVDYANWYNSLSAKDQALVWINQEQTIIDGLNSLENIDKARAIKGEVVGTICGDATVGFYAAKLFLQVKQGKDSKERAAEGIKISWLTVNLAVEKLGQLLPESCKNQFQQVIADHEVFINGFLDNPEAFNNEFVTDQVENLIVDIRAIAKSPAGMDKTDLDYAVLIVTRRLQGFQD